MKIILALALSAVVAAAQYDTAPLMKFRADREATLKADNGWLTVAGLHFLNQGDNQIGSDPGNDIVLDFPSVPKHAGVITMNGTAVRIKAADGQTLIINDKPVTESELHGAFDGKPQDTVKFDGLTFFVHYSGPRLALRVRDQKSPIRTNFRGLRWFDPNPGMRTTAIFKAYPEPKVVQIPNILGDLEPFNAIGTVTFSLNGADHTMEAWRVGTAPVVRLSRPDERQGQLPVGAIPVRRCAGRWKSRHGLQLHPESAVRVQPVHDVPAAAAAEPVERANRGWREEVPRRHERSLTVAAGFLIRRAGPGSLSWSR